MLKDSLIKEVQKDIPVIKAALPSRSEVLVIRTLIGVGCLCVAIFLIWFFEKDRVDHPLLYWPLTFALLFKFFKLLHEWYHYWGIGRLSGREVSDAKAHAPVFTVDVMTTACPGEPLEMIKATLLAMKNIRYPHETYLGDEGNDPELRAFCLENGIHHITRNNRTNAKAGNINNILAQSQGDICLVLDPDHEPHPLFLDRVLPHFEDEQIGFVQSVQAYKNQKTSLVAYGAAEQTYHFYGPLMMSMSNYGTAQAIGANCVFRREALDSIGGHAAGLAEDMHTSMLLHAKGWKSVYVPEILSRGQVPSTLSAFYKQQLKWSRGTLELLFFVLPKIWFHLSWRQRFHYLTLPFYYLAAFIILIDLAVPAISLLIGRTPWLVSLDRFMIFIIPVVCLTILIRQYAQRWLLEYQERGFVLMGGLLKLGAWWVYLLGFFTTILRVKIPYIPTPKEDEPENELGLNIPNILVAGLCLFAVAYGLSQDFSPFSLVMAAFSLVNAAVLGVNVLISQQKFIEQIKAYLRRREQVHYRSMRLRIYWWKLRHSFYYLIRTRALILLLAVLVFVGFYTGWVERTSLQSVHFSEPASGETVFYRGIYLPVTHGQEQVNENSMKSAAGGSEPAIISFYWPWGKEEGFPVALLQQINEQAKFAMISWGPVEHNGGMPQESADFFTEIVAGKHDAFLKVTASQLAQLQQPVFVRFAHAFDAPQHPWSVDLLDRPERFKQAWQYVVDLFRREGAYNAIWVYNPLEPVTFELFYPGDGYVDWLGITARDAESFAGYGKNKSFEDFYLPFKEEITASSHLRKKPVMLAELGPEGSEQERTAWLEAAEIFLQGEEQVKGLVYFSPEVDQSTLYAESRAATGNSRSFSAGAVPAFGAGRQSASQLAKEELGGMEVLVTDARRELPAGIRAVMYQPVSYWNQSYLPLTKVQLDKDFKKMKALQLNTIYRPVTDIYDRNVYHAARSNGFNVVQQLTEQTLSFIDNAVQYEQLLAWSVGEIRANNAAFWSPEGQHNFLNALAQLDRLGAAIKEKDERPVLAMVNYSTLLRAAPQLFQSLSHVDIIGINIQPGDDLEAISQIWEYHKPSQAYMINITQGETATYPEEIISVSDWQGASLFRLLQQKNPSAESACKGFVYQNWMDKNLGKPEGGLVNHRGELKACYLDSMMPETEIFLYSNDPEHALKKGKNYQFYAVSDPQSVADSLNYEWYVFDKFTGEEEGVTPFSPGGSSIYFNPPANSTYQIILSVRRNQQLLYNTYLEVYVPL